MPIKMLSALLLALIVATFARAEPLTYQGDAGPGKGKHIVFIASDHEYRSEETLPALARILAKRQGFKCTVLFGVDEQGVIRPGHNNVPGLEALETADLMVEPALTCSIRNRSTQLESKGCRTSS